MKPLALSDTELIPSSPPLRGRGLKPDAQQASPGAGCVAPPAGAWIETLHKLSSTKNRPVSPPLRGRGLKHEPIRSMVERMVCRPPCGGVD